jgi:hypothetical protein
MNFETFWQVWPASTRKGARSTCKAKWDKMKLDLQAEQIVKHVEWQKTTEAWKKANGTFIPAPLVYINQQRWDGADIPEMEITLSVSYKDPALAKIEADRMKAAPMPDHVRQTLQRLRQAL